MSDAATPELEFVHRCRVLQDEDGRCTAALKQVLPTINPPSLCLHYFLSSICDVQLIPGALLWWSVVICSLPLRILLVRICFTYSSKHQNILERASLSKEGGRAAIMWLMQFWKLQQCLKLQKLRDDKMRLHHVLVYYGFCSWRNQYLSSLLCKCLTGKTCSSVNLYGSYLEIVQSKLCESCCLWKSLMDG